MTSKVKRLWFEAGLHPNHVISSMIVTYIHNALIIEKHMLFLQMCRRIGLYYKVKILYC